MAKSVRRLSLEAFAIGHGNVEPSAIWVDDENGCTASPHHARYAIRSPDVSADRWDRWNNMCKVEAQRPRRKPPTSNHPAHRSMT